MAPARRAVGRRRRRRPVYRGVARCRFPTLHHHDGRSRHDAARSKPEAKPPGRARRTLSASQAASFAPTRTRPSPIPSCSEHEGHGGVQTGASRGRRACVSSHGGRHFLHTSPPFRHLITQFCLPRPHCWFGETLVPGHPSFRRLAHMLDALSRPVSTPSRGGLLLHVMMLLMLLVGGAAAPVPESRYCAQGGKAARWAAPTSILWVKQCPRAGRQHGLCLRLISLLVRSPCSVRWELHARVCLLRLAVAVVREVRTSLGRPPCPCLVHESLSRVTPRARPVSTRVFDILKLGT